MSFDLESQTITVAEERLFEGGCPDLTLNFTVNSQFTLAPTDDMIDLFICPDSQMVNSLWSITCRRSNGDMVTYPAFDTSNTVKACPKIGEVPVRRSVKDDLGLSNLTLEEALLKGFDLRYNIRDDKSCRDCSTSGGVCGSNSVSTNFQCLCFDRPHNSTCHVEGEYDKIYLKILQKIIIGVMGGVVVIVLLITALGLWKVKTCSQKDENLETLIPLKRYSYARVKKITVSFTHEVGKGGFGIVYRGNLRDGRKVAVKILKDSKRNNGEDFINEVASMSRTSHVNIVTLIGFCYEGSKRAIIYEFLENGSLDKYISSKKSSDMDWSSLYGIALGVARGVEYLHNGCRERIVHFDIKPQNILLDDNLCPKVSDFGLAKLCENNESVLSLLHTRGTIGYIAPEVFSRMYGRVSHKSDVYSYGMLVLEMIGARNKTSTKNSGSNTSSMYFPDWIYKDLEKGDDKRLIENGFSNDEEELVRKMTLVGLWCVQSSPSNRPAMNRVVEMMEGSADALQVPPRPVLQIPVAPYPEYSLISEENSSPYEV